MSPALLAILGFSAPSAEALERAEAALSDFRPEDALNLLKGIDGPHPYEEHIRLYEKLGIAYAYLDRPDPAVEAFRKMLALDPARAISYTLSPKVTFLFERARKAAAEAPRPAMDVSWPRTLRTVDPVPVELQVLADPLGFLRSAEVFYRLQGGPRYRRVSVTLAPVSGFVSIEIPPLGAAAEMSQTVELYVVAKDEVGNEVFHVGKSSRPREIELRYEPPEPWFDKWWVWAAAGVVVAAGATALVVVATDEPDPMVDGVIRVRSP